MNEIPQEDRARMGLLDILFLHTEKRPPIDVNALAADLGLRVVYRDDFPEDISGQIIKDPQRGGPSGYLVNVNAGHWRVRQRYTLAHEIAHFLLHADRIGDGLTDDGLYRSSLKSVYEREADQLAANILMPAAMVRVHSLAGLGLKAMAKAFDVSEQAMKIRLRQMKLS